MGKSGLGEWVVALGRVLMAVIFIHAGILKILNYAHTGEMMAAHGVPAALLPLVILLEVGGGAAFLLGLFTRFLAAALALFSIAAIALFVWPPQNQLGIIIFYAETAMVGGLLNFAVRGGGAIALDRLLFRRRGGLRG